MLNSNLIAFLTEISLLSLWINKSITTLMKADFIEVMMLLNVHIIVLSNWATWQLWSTYDTHDGRHFDFNEKFRKCFDLFTDICSFDIAPTDSHFKIEISRFRLWMIVNYEKALEYLDQLVLFGKTLKNFNERSIEIWIFLRQDYVVELERCQCSKEYEQFSWEKTNVRKDVFQINKIKLVETFGATTTPTAKIR